MINESIAVIQARMSSTRLPGKVMMRLKDKPIIWHIVERLKLSKKLSKIIVATSKEKSDDFLHDFCDKNNINIYRGNLENVLSRFINLIDIYNPKYIVRITGDCPLIFPEYIDEQINALKKYNADLTWLTQKVQVFDGQGAFSADFLKKISKLTSDPEDLEHVCSPFIAKNPSLAKIVGINPPPKYTNLKFRLAVDEISDFKLMEKIYNELYDDKPIDFYKVIDLLMNNVTLSQVNNLVKDSKINLQVSQDLNNWKKNVNIFYDLNL
ncbi:MAG: glycosyltransferase family protein [Prochlorococcus marinus XMU1429]|nr:glycosyltransferase family protein [Prochlorococcus marinus XMU1429]